MSEAIAVLGIDEFCEHEARGDRRHELVGGRVYDMAGGSERHDLAAGSRPPVRGTGTGGPRRRVSAFHRQPKGVDRREKAPAFAASRRLRGFDLVDPDRRRIEVAVPSSAGSLRWQAYGPGDVVPTGFADIDVDEFYDRLGATATTAG